VSETAAALEAGTTLLEDGFRRLSKPSDPGRLMRARAVLLELGVSIPVPSWDALASFCDTGWFATAASERILRRRLRLLDSSPSSFATLASAIGQGVPVHLRGTCRRLPGSRAGASLWQVQELRDDRELRWRLEEGTDFLLAGPDGCHVHVFAAGGHLMSPPALTGGEQVSVFGFVDEIADRYGLTGSPNGRGGRMLALRSGAELPLLVSGMVR
jgi:hypothetical protein